MNEIGKQIKLRRVELEMTQRQLAKKSGTSELTVINCEKGGKLSMSSIMKLCNALGLEIVLKTKEL